MVGEKSFEKIKVILKNAKINLILANNNLSLSYNLQDINCCNGVIRTMNQIKVIEDKLEIDISHIENLYDDYLQAEKINEVLITSLTGKIESVINTSSIVVENNNTELIRSISTNTKNEFMTINKKKNLKNVVGRVPTADGGKKVTNNPFAQIWNRIVETSKKPVTTSKSPTSKTGNTTNKSSTTSGWGMFNKWISNTVSSFTSKVDIFVKNVKKVSDQVKEKGYFEINGKYYDKNAKKINVIGQIPDDVHYEDGFFYEYTNGYRGYKIAQFPGWYDDPSEWYYVNEERNIPQGKFDGYFTPMPNVDLFLDNVAFSVLKVPIMTMTGIEWLEKTLSDVPVDYENNDVGLYDSYIKNKKEDKRYQENLKKSSTPTFSENAGDIVGGAIGHEILNKLGMPSSFTTFFSGIGGGVETIRKEKEKGTIISGVDEKIYMVETVSRTIASIVIGDKAVNKIKSAFSETAGTIVNKIESITKEVIVRTGITAVNNLTDESTKMNLGWQSVEEMDQHLEDSMEDLAIQAGTDFLYTMLHISSYRKKEKSEENEKISDGTQKIEYSENTVEQFREAYSDFKERVEKESLKHFGFYELIKHDKEEKKEETKKEDNNTSNEINNNFSFPNFDTEPIIYDPEKIKEWDENDEIKK